MRQVALPVLKNAVSGDIEDPHIVLTEVIFLGSPLFMSSHYFSLFSFMANPYFQFKQFTIRHDQCAMKVCTDACIFGAWFANRISSCRTVLDIGAGSGLLTLMLAQKTEGYLHAIEKDVDSFEQMKYNIEQSTWKEKIKVFKGDATTYAFPKQYNFIICNPPFYENDLKSDNEKNNIAKHDLGLTLETLTTAIDQNLAADGSFGVLLPFQRIMQYEQMASLNGFFLSEKLLVRQTPNHAYFRGILHFTRLQPATVQTRELVIREQDGNYSETFTALLKDYYLYL